MFEFLTNSLAWSKVLGTIKVFNISCRTKKNTEEELIKQFRKMGSNLFKIALCIDNKPVNPNRERKSIGAEQTFSKDIVSEAFILEKLDAIQEAESAGIEVERSRSE